MTAKGADGWKIYVDDTLIGIAYYRASDQPWYICDFEPTSAFETYRSVFDEYATLVNNPSEASTDMDFEEYYETKIASLNLILTPFGDVWNGNVFVAQIYDGNEAWLRPL